MAGLKKCSINHLELRLFVDLSAILRFCSSAKEDEYWFWNRSKASKLLSLVLKLCWNVCSPLAGLLKRLPGLNEKLYEILLPLDVDYSIVCEYESKLYNMINQ